MEERVLQPHEIEERVGIPIQAQPVLFSPIIQNPMEGTEMAISDMRNMRRVNLGETFTPDEDVTETLEDGRTIQIAVKGSPIPMAEAIRLGLVKESKQAGPSEVKEEAGQPAPSEAKAEAKKSNGK